MCALSLSSCWTCMTSNNILSIWKIAFYLYFCLLCRNVVVAIILKKPIECRWHYTVFSKYRLFVFFVVVVVVIFLLLHSLSLSIFVIYYNFELCTQFCCLLFLCNRLPNPRTTTATQMSVPWMMMMLGSFYEPSVHCTSNNIVAIVHVVVLLFFFSLRCDENKYGCVCGWQKNEPNEKKKCSTLQQSTRAFETL